MALPKKSKTKRGDAPSSQLVQEDVAAFLAEKRKTLRAQFAVRPLTPDEQQVSEDVRWAQQDPEVQAAHRGEFVVPYRRKIVAHGRNAAAVLKEAACKTGANVDDLPLVGIIVPLMDIPH